MTDTWRPRARSTVAWVVYDLANTIFALGVSGLYFAAWVTDRGASDGALALAIAGAMAVVIVLAPWFGALGDAAPRRVVYLIPSTLVAVGATMLLATFGVGASLAIYAVALIGFNLGGVVYDALLPDVSTVENRGRISGWGVGVGYVGSFIAVGVGAVLLDAAGYPAVFRTIGLLFLVFSLPAFFFIEERPRRAVTGAGSVFGSLRRLVGAWRLAAATPGVVRFLAGRFLYTDAINTLIGGFLTIFVINELGFSDGEVQGLLALAISTAIVGGIAGGRLTDRFGPRRVLNTTLVLWLGVLAGGIAVALLDATEIAWMVGAAGGLALGATWASDRVYMARLSPPANLGEFYGLYATVGRFATVLGPLVWGLLVTQLGLPRVAAMGALMLFVVAALIVLHGVVEPSSAGDQPAGRPGAVT